MQVGGHWRDYIRLKHSALQGALSLSIRGFCRLTGPRLVTHSEQPLTPMRTAFCVGALLFFGSIVVRAQDAGPTSTPGVGVPAAPVSRPACIAVERGRHYTVIHTYREMMSASSPFAYPYPSLNEGTDWSRLVSDPVHNAKPTISGTWVTKVGQRFLVSKTGQGRQVTHHGAIDYVTAAYVTHLGSGFVTKLNLNEYSAPIDDPDVDQAYLDQLIPEAIKYSSGLLDYFSAASWKLRQSGRDQITKSGSRTGPVRASAQASSPCGRRMPVGTGRLSRWG